MFPTSEPKTAGASPQGYGRYGLPRIEAIDLGEAAARPPGKRPLEKKKFSDPHQTQWASRQGCGEVCREDGRWISPSPSEHRGPE